MCGMGKRLTCAVDRERSGGIGVAVGVGARVGVAVGAGDAVTVALAVAEKHLRANGIECFHLTAGNLVEAIEQTFDVVAANILAEVILALLPDVVAVINPDGLLICSGIITAKKNAVLAGLQENGFVVVEILEKEDWVAIAARKAEA